MKTQDTIIVDQSILKSFIFCMSIVGFYSIWLWGVKFSWYKIIQVMFNLKFIMQYG
jgi:hypothetical protein